MASPTYFPEGHTQFSQDSEERRWQKINGALYDTYGDRGPTYFPEGSKPSSQDNLERSLAKINALLA